MMGSFSGIGSVASSWGSRDLVEESVALVVADGCAPSRKADWRGVDSGAITALSTAGELFSDKVALKDA